MYKVTSHTKIYMIIYVHIKIQKITTVIKIVIVTIPLQNKSIKH